MEMQYRNLGNSGLFISALSLGSWVTFKNQVDINSAKEMMTLAYDSGINFFDNAEVYADGVSEEIMGSALKELGFSRDSFLVSSKVFWGGSRPTQRGLSRKHIFDCAHAALKRLKLDYLDLYYCHRPDIDTPIIETVRAMDNLIKQGKILYWGTSEWSAAQIQEAMTAAHQYNLTPPTVEQPQYNLFHREKIEKDYLSLYKQGLGTTIWSPLSSGVLTGKYNDGIPEGSRLSMESLSWLKEQFMSEEGQKKIEKAKQLTKIADEIGASLTNMSLAWCLKNPNVSSVILGASKTSQLRDNLECLNTVGLLTSDVMEKIDSIVDNRPTPPTNWKA